MPFSEIRKKASDIALSVTRHTDVYRAQKRMTRGWGNLTLRISIPCSYSRFFFSLTMFLTIPFLFFKVLKTVCAKCMFIKTGKVFHEFIDKCLFEFSMPGLVLGHGGTMLNGPTWPLSSQLAVCRERQAQGIKNEAWWVF